MVARGSRLHINSRQRQHPLKDRRQANQHHKQFEKIRQAGFADKFIDGPKANCADDANNQNPIKTESMATPGAGAANAYTERHCVAMSGRSFFEPMQRLSPGFTDSIDPEH